MSAPLTWPDGTPRSTCNGFDIVPRGIDAVPLVPRRKKPSPGITLPGTRVLDRNGRRTVDLNAKPLTGKLL